MDKIMKNERGLKLVTGALQVTKQVQKIYFISDVLPDQVLPYMIKWFLSYSENYIC